MGIRGTRTRAPPQPIADARDPNVYVGPRVSDRPFLKKFAANVLLDQKSIWASPLQVDRLSAKWWIAAGVGTAALLAADHTVKDSTGACRDPGKLRSLGHRCILGGTASEINKGRIARFGRQREAPVIAAIFGAIGSAMGRLLWTPPRAG